MIRNCYNTDDEKDMEGQMAAYLDNGTLDILSIQYRLENGFVVNRMKMTPLAYIMRVDEPDFGCEGRPETKVVYEKVYALTLKGQKVWLMGEKDLEISGIYDNTWVCRLESTHQLVCWREGTEEMIPVPEDLWNNKLEEK